MEKSTNGTVIKPSEIIVGDVAKSKKYDRVYNRIKSEIIAKYNILWEKELLFMSSIIFIWFFAFFYFVLFVFTDGLKEQINLTITPF
jgi:hypothetical protein